MHYHRYEFTKNSVKAVGGMANTYAHYCPIKDFLLISQVILERFKKQDVITPREVFVDLLNRRSASGKTFSKEKHEYKLGIALFVLVENGFLANIRRGEYTMEKSSEEIQEWLDKVEKKGDQN